jgi:hypothetical protein
MKQTAVQELINVMVDVRRILTDCNSKLPLATSTIESRIEMLSDVIGWAKSMIEIEKEHIIDAHIEGQRVFDDYPHTQWTNDVAEAYYNKTFKTPLK